MRSTDVPCTAPRRRRSARRCAQSHAAPVDMSCRDMLLSLPLHLILHQYGIFKKACGELIDMSHYLVFYTLGVVVASSAGRMMRVRLSPAHESSWLSSGSQQCNLASPSHSLLSIGAVLTKSNIAPSALVHPLPSNNLRQRHPRSAAGLCLIRNSRSTLPCLHILRIGLDVSTACNTC